MRLSFPNKKTILHCKCNAATLLIVPLQPVVPPLDQLLLLVQTGFQHVDTAVAPWLMLVLFDDRNTS